MKFKQKFFTACLFSLALSTSAHADNGWGDIADGADLGGWGAPNKEETKQAPQAAPGKPACGTDDPRYETLVPLLRELQAGASIEPMQTSFATYVSLSNNVRTILGDNIYISSPDCTEQYLFEGELTGKVNVPFTDLWQVINTSLRTNDLTLMTFIAKNTQAAPESALSIISMVEFVHLDDSEIRKLYSVIAPDKAKPTDILKPLMLEVFVAFGGVVIQSEREKIAFLEDYGGTLNHIYLERRGGDASIIGPSRVSNIVPRTTMLLKTVGLRPNVAGNDAKKLSEK